MSVESVGFDPAEYLETTALQADYLDTAFGTGDDATIAHAFGVFARAPGHDDGGVVPAAAAD